MTTKSDQQVIHLLDPNSVVHPTFNSRISFDEEALVSLMKEIERDGQTSPIEVEAVSEGKQYLLHFGSRRLEATKRLGIQVKAIVVGNMGEKERAFRNAIENTQREDLTTFELARTFSHLRELDVPIQETADRLGFGKSYVSILVNVYAKLADPIKEAWERAAVIERERNPGKLSDRQRAEMKATSVQFLYSDIIKIKDQAKQVETWEASVVELMKRAPAPSSGGDGKGKGKGKSKGKGGGAAATIYRVTADRYANTITAFKVAMKSDPEGYKTVKLALQYLVGDIDKVKGVIDAAGIRPDQADGKAA